MDKTGLSVLIDGRKALYTRTTFLGNAEKATEPKPDDSLRR